MERPLIGAPYLKLANFSGIGFLCFYHFWKWSPTCKCKEEKVVKASTMRCGHLLKRFINLVVSTVPEDTHKRMNIILKLICFEKLLPTFSHIGLVFTISDI